VTQAHLQQTWQAACSSISTSIQQGRGHKVPGLCTVLPAAGGPKVLLSDTLLKIAPQLQLGQGCVHHASVRQQVQGVDTVNTASLAHRCGSCTPLNGTVRGLLVQQRRLLLLKKDQVVRAAVSGSLAVSSNSPTTSLLHKHELKHR
jgi:hypothetical protein